MMDELVKAKKYANLTKEELSKVKLDQSLSIEELLKQNKNSLPSILGRLGRGGASRGITGPVDMQSRFMIVSRFVYLLFRITYIRPLRMIMLRLLKSIF